jgi:hypothetical protein
MVVIRFFSKIEVNSSCQGSSFYQGLLFFAFEAKDRLNYTQAGGQADAYDFRERARKFLHCRCFGEQCPVSRLVHKGQLQALIRASASLLTALVKHLYETDRHDCRERARRFLHCRCFGE